MTALTMSSSITSLAPALAELQSVLKDADKDASNPHFHSRYATLAEVLQTIRPAASAAGFALVQGISMRENRVVVSTLLLHKSGEWLRCDAETPIAKQDPQGVGAGSTYLRRYVAAAILGITQDDDDGNAASLPPTRPPAKTKAPPAKTPAASWADLIQRFDSATSPEELGILAAEYTALPAASKEVVREAATRAKARIGTP